MPHCTPLATLLIEREKETFANMADIPIQKGTQNAKMFQMETTEDHDDRCSLDDAKLKNASSF